MPLSESPSQWVEIHCLLCGSGGYHIVHDNLDMSAGPRLYKITDHSPRPEVRMVCCDHCGFIYLNPRQTPDAYIDNYVTMVDEKYLAEEKGRRASARRILKLLNQQHKSKGRLLDVGCAAGFLLDEARQDGWEVHGVDLSAWAVDYARQQLGLTDVVQGDLDKARFSAASFDAIVMTDVIEHVIDPQGLFEQIRGLLKDDGLFCCTTPDVGSLISRLQGTKWWNIKPSHLYYFDQKSLGQLFQQTGFALIKTRAQLKTFSLRYWTSNMAAFKPALGWVDHFVQQHPKLASLSMTIALGDQIEMFGRKSPGRADA